MLNGAARTATAFHRRATATNLPPRIARKCLQLAVNRTDRMTGALQDCKAVA
jgi:hypothetical protein